MLNVLKGILGGALLALGLGVFMVMTGLGFVIISDGNAGIKKTVSQYDMQVLEPGWHVYMPIYSTVTVVPTRAKLINYSVSEADHKDSELLIYEPVLKGLDKKGTPIKLALSIEVRPIKDKLPLMFKDEGYFDVAFEKRVKQPNRDAVQNVISNFLADTIMDNRDEVSAKLSSLIRASYASNPYFELVNINLKDIVLPPNIVKLQLEVAGATQESLKEKELIEKSKNKALAVKEEAKGRADAYRMEAQGRADAVEIEAQANAKALVLKANAKATYNRLISESATTKSLASDRIEAWRAGGSLVPYMVGNEKSQYIIPIKDNKNAK